jgi:uncharacterized protein YggE
MRPSIMRAGVACTLATTLLLVPGPSAGVAQALQGRDSPPEVRTQATARRSVRSDLAILTVQISALGVSPREAGARVAARADSIRSSLRALGIPKDSVWTSGSMGWYWSGRIEVVQGQQVIHNPPPGAGGRSYVTQDTAYRARDVLEVRISDMRKVGPVIDTLLALRLTEINGPRFLATSTAAERQAALREATERAQLQARTMAEAAGMKLGRLLDLNSNQLPTETLELVASAGMVVTRGSGPPTSMVEPFVPLEVSVSARWELVAQ